MNAYKRFVPSWDMPTVFKALVCAAVVQHETKTTTNIKCIKKILKKHVYNSNSSNARNVRKGIEITFSSLKLIGEGKKNKEVLYLLVLTSGNL